MPDEPQRWGTDELKKQLELLARVGLCAQHMRLNGVITPEQEQEIQQIYSTMMSESRFSSVDNKAATQRRLHIAAIRKMADRLEEIAPEATETIKAFLEPQQPSL